MGVEYTAYTVYGCQLEADSKLREFYDEDSNCDIFLEDDCKLDIIIDGMCGEYAVAGMILGEVDVYSDSVFEEYEVDELPVKKAEIIEDLETKFPQFVKEIDKPWKLLVFVHAT